MRPQPRDFPCFLVSALLALVGLVALFAFIWIPFYTFGEDIKVLKDSGLTTILILGVIQAIWAASNSVSDEIEGRTALTVLSKPIGRRSFIIGKFFGISWTAAIIFVFLGLMLLACTAYKPIYDAKESSQLTEYEGQGHGAPYSYRGFYVQGKFCRFREVFLPRIGFHDMDLLKILDNWKSDSSK